MNSNESKSNPSSTILQFEISWESDPNSVISRLTVRIIASLITISSQCILTLQPTMGGLNQNNTSER